MDCPKCGGEMYLIKKIWHCSYCGYYGNPGERIIASDNTNEESEE